MLMQSAWIDRDADAAVARYEKLGRDVACGSIPRGYWVGIRAWCCTAAAIPR